MELRYPEQVKTAMERLESAGHTAYLVGGALRDALLGREAHDFDITTSARPHETERVFADLPVIKTGLKHGTLTVIIDGFPLEITTFRIDGDYHDARHPDGVTFTDRVEGDLARRDFTVNAMAYRPAEGLVDLFGGREDLTAGLIRAVGDPAARFSEDALRILRAFRFMSKLDFDIEPQTLAATHACREGLSRISAERITAELYGLFEGRGAEKALRVMIAQGIFEAFASDFDAENASVGNLDSIIPVFEIRFAFFLKNCKESGESLIKELRLSNISASRIQTLLRLREMPISPREQGSLRRILAAAGRFGDDVEALLSADGFFPLERQEATEALASVRAIRARGDCLSVSELAVDGRELLARGFSGRAVGETLAALLDHVLDDPRCNQKDTLLAIADQMRVDPL